MSWEGAVNGFTKMMAPRTAAALESNTSAAGPIIPGSDWTDVMKAAKEDADSHPIPQLAPMDAGLQPIPPGGFAEQPMSSVRMSQRFETKPNVLAGFNL